MVSLENKVIVITGASSGIGRATAMEFAKRGAKTVLVARRAEKLEKIIDQMRPLNDNSIFVQTDIANESEVINLFDIVENKFKRVDILVNTAGRGLKSEICDTTHKDWLSVINTNLTGVFLCTREAVRRMLDKKNQGHIITVSSIAGLYGAATHAAYCASKHGVTGFNRSIKWELRKYGIKVSTIHPARVDTEFFNVYNKRPPRKQMLSPGDLANDIVAIAKRSFIRIIFVRIANVFKRIYYFIRYAKA